MIAVLGLGFVGLSTALGFCEKTDHNVYGFDVNSERANTIASGRVPFYEPHMPEALERYNRSSFFVSDTLAGAVKDADFVFVCVGTPCDDEGRVDLCFVRAAVEETLRCKAKGKPFTLVIKSTTPPTTLCEEVAPICEGQGFRLCEDIKLCTNPEFLREGYSWEDFVHADRIIIGEYVPGCGEALSRLYQGFEAPIICVSANTAEFIKYLSNSLLASMISFANEFSMIADTIGGIDVAKAFQLLHMDKRWFSPKPGRPAGMSSYVYPGCGYGGYCLPKDTLAIREKAKERDYTPRMLAAAIDVNDSVKRHIAEKIIHSASGGAVGVLGLAFKPGSDDVRYSASAEILRIVCESGITVYAYDPMAMDNFAIAYALPIEYLDSAEAVLSKSESVAVLTAWDEFKRLDYSGKTVIDARFCLT